MKKAKLRIGWIFLIIYIWLFVILLRWSMKLSSPDMRISDEDLKAFSGTAQTKEEDFKFYEPNLEDLTYTVSYRNLTQKGDDVSKEYTISIKNTDTDDEKDKIKKGVIPKKDEKLGSESDIPKMREIKEKEMIAIGYKKGFLSQAVGKMINNPKAIKSLFDNSYVVKGFLSRERVQKVLSDPKYLEAFLSDNQVVSNFLNNENVKAALSKPEVINAIAQSRLISEIISSPAVTSLLSNRDSVNKILQNNPQLGDLLANPNIMQAISQNPQASKLFSNIQK